MRCPSRSGRDKAAARERSRRSRPSWSLTRDPSVDRPRRSPAPARAPPRSRTASPQPAATRGVRTNRGACSRTESDAEVDRQCAALDTAGDEPASCPRSSPSPRGVKTRSGPADGGKTARTGCTRCASSARPVGGRRFASWPLSSLTRRESSGARRPRPWLRQRARSRQGASEVGLPAGSRSTTPRSVQLPDGSSKVCSQIDRRRTRPKLRAPTSIAPPPEAAPHGVTPRLL